MINNLKMKSEYSNIDVVEKYKKSVDEIGLWKSEKLYFLNI